MENFGNLSYAKDYMTNGIAHFRNSQILDHKEHKVEIIVSDKPIVVDLGKNYLCQKPNYKAIPLNGDLKKGNYFYLYSKPLQNYYHTIIDSLGCLFYYFELKKSIPDLKLLINKNHKNINVWPPFVKEMLDLLGLSFKLTNQHCLYENIYLGDVLNNGPCSTGGKRAIKQEYFPMLEKLVESALSKKLDVPIYDNIYISRRTKYNPNYSKDLIGEDNTQKRQCVNEDEVVDILRGYGFQEVFGENYTLAEKITMFHHMKKYVTFSGAGITNTFFRRGGVIGGISSPNFRFPVRKREHLVNSKYFKNIIRAFHETSVIDTNARKYNNPWKIDNLDNFSKWAKEL